jgi:hypothetical protein
MRRRVLVTVLAVGALCCAGSAPDGQASQYSHRVPLSKLHLPQPCRQTVGRLSSILGARLGRRRILTAPVDSQSYSGLLFGVEQCQYGAHPVNVLSVPSLEINAFAYGPGKVHDGVCVPTRTNSCLRHRVSRWHYDKLAGKIGWWGYEQDSRSIPGTSDLFRGDCVPRSATSAERTVVLVDILSRQGTRNANLSVVRMANLFRHVCNQS